MKKFWNFKEIENNERVLYLEGPIGLETWFGDEITPKAFKSELNSGDGDIIVVINSPGGDVFAATEIYTALKEYPGKVNVKIIALAASAASVVAMAGDEVLMSPTALMMIHDPITAAIGGTLEMEKTISMLNKTKEAIINAYEAKTGIPRDKIAEMMTNETWLDAKSAVNLGFADGILWWEDDKNESEEEIPAVFSQKMVMNSIMAKISVKPLKEVRKETKANLNYGKYHEILKNLKSKN
jgi:ATP-dependent Clp protease protease subunit